jgi:predicted porin
MFKKMIAILAIMIAGTSAYAEDKIELGYRFDDQRNTTNDQYALTVDWQTKLNSNFSWGLGFRNIEREQDSRVTNRYMVKLNYDYNMVYVNTVVGQKHQSLKPTTEFWQAEAGVKYKVNDNVQVKVGYAYREGFGGRDEDYHQGPRVAVKYKLDPRWAVNVKYDYFDFGSGVKRDRYGISIEKRLF